MANLPDFANDVYISYAHRDNQPLGAQRGWVDTFAEALNVRLGQVLGRNPRIWRDRQLSGTSVLTSETVDAIERSAILLCLVSPSYVTSEWCLRELEAFRGLTLRDAGDAQSFGSRVFKVVISPVPYAQQPNELERLVGLQFFSMDQSSGIVHQLQQTSGKETELLFWERLNQLAHEIARKLSNLSISLSPRSVADRPSEVASQPEALSVAEDEKRQRKLRVFLCHSSGDKPQVRQIYKLLASVGADPWLDEENLIPGQRWELEIPKAVRASDAIIVCISKTSITKVGYIQKELRQALDVADEQPEDAVFLIPARLEDCKIPERLSGQQWVNLFEERGNALLIRALQARATQLSVEAIVNVRPV